MDRHTEDPDRGPEEADRGPEDADRRPEDADRRPEIVAAADYVTGVIPLARPGVVVWLGEDAPDHDEVDRAASMRDHPSNVAPPATGSPPDEDDTSDEDATPSLRAVS